MELFFGGSQNLSVSYIALIDKKFIQPMHPKQKRSKRRLNNSASHFSLVKKSSSPSVATAVTSPLFKSPNTHHRSGTNYMRRSQGIQGRQHYKQEFYKSRPDAKKDNQYGLMKDKGQKNENSKHGNGKISTYRSIDNFIKVENISKIEQEEEKNKIPFRRMRSVRRSPTRRQQNPMKDSCSTQNTHRYTQSPIAPSQQQLNQLNKVIDTLTQSTQQYRNLYERSKHRLQSAEKEVSEQKIKYQRIKNIYKQRINQLMRNRESGKPNIGHLFTYQQFPKDIIPDSIIVENSLDCSSSDINNNFQLENCSKISNLSLESH